MRRESRLRFTAVLVTVAAIALLIGPIGCRCTPAEEPAQRPPVATSTPSTEPAAPSAPETAPPAVTETGAPPGSPTEPGEPAPTTALRSFSVYLSANSKVQPASRTLPRTPAPLRLALTELLQGPERHERDAGLSSAIPAGTVLRGVRVTDGVAVIDLSDDLSASGGGSVRLRYAQLVFTATQYPSVRSVRVLVDGRPSSQLGAGLTGRALTRADFEAEMPAILVDSPAWGAEVSREQITLRGTANVFEANFQLWVYDGAGRRVFADFVQATSGTGTRGTWSKRVDLSRARPGTGRVRVFEYSAENGEPINRVDVLVNIR